LLFIATSFTSPSLFLSIFVRAVVSSSVNIVIYCSLSSKFRQEFNLLLARAASTLRSCVDRASAR
jgi:hypothetical protein